MTRKLFCKIECVLLRRQLIPLLKWKTSFRTQGMHWFWKVVIKLMKPYYNVYSEIRLISIIIWNYKQTYTTRVIKSKLINTFSKEFSHSAMLPNKFNFINAGYWLMPFFFEKVECRLFHGIPIKGVLLFHKTHVNEGIWIKKKLITTALVQYLFYLFSIPNCQVTPEIFE